MLEDAEPDILAFYAFYAFPDPPLLTRRVEWLVGRGYLSAESIALCLAGPTEDTDNEIKEEVPELQAA
jgi:hypothetical protein